MAHNNVFGRNDKLSLTNKLIYRSFFEIITKDDTGKIFGNGKGYLFNDLRQVQQEK